MIRHRYACLPLRQVDQASAHWSPSESASTTAPSSAASNESASRTARRQDDSNSSQLLKDGIHTLSVAKELPDGYLAKYVDESPDLAWADKKPVFQVSTRVVFVVCFVVC
jgi:hypothetical protein